MVVKTPNNYGNDKFNTTDRFHAKLENEQWVPRQIRNDPAQKFRAKILQLIARIKTVFRTRFHD